MLESSPNRIIFSLKPFEISIVPFTTENKSYHNVTIANYGVKTEPGFPMLPVTGALVQIPPGSDVSVTILESFFEELTDINLPPAPDIQADLAKDNISYFYKKDLSVYNLDAYWPSKLAEFSDKARWRGRDIGRIQINPFQYNPVHKILRVYKSLKIQVSLSKPLAQKTSSSRNRLDISDKLTQSILLNGGYESLLEENISRPIDQRRSWYNPQAMYYKLFIDEEGIYSLTYDDLLNARVEVNQLNLQTLKILHQGLQIPIWIEGPQESTLGPENTIYFYGDRNRSSDTYYDLYTDTNVYWLTSDGELGERYQLVAANPSPAIEVPFYWETLHIEKDSLFYRWDIASTLDPGEGWVWRYFFDNDREIFNFNITGFYQAVNACSIKVRAQGTTLDPVNPDHHIRISINEGVVGDAFFDDREELIWVLPFPSSLLKEGANKFELHLVPDTGAELNQIYLDWVEIVYPRVHAANESRLKFQDANPSVALREYTMVNFADDTITIFNPLKGKVWKPSTKRVSFYRVESAGFDAGNYVRISADFETYNLSSRGHNLISINRNTGRIDTRNFDTYALSEAANEMADYINSLPEGSVVLIGIADEGSGAMTERAYLALESLGSTLSREVKSRDSWALIGWKGAPIGSVAEVLSKRFMGTAIIADTLTNDQAFRYSASFRDSSTTDNFYYGVSTQGIKKGLQIQKDKISDLHSQTNGADYIIISHENFIAEAQLLANYREEHNGFRTVVIDVQDVYDEFNGGIVNPQAMKDFLSYTYSNWQKPAPSFVILFGDASWDPKKLMKETTKTNYVPTYGDPVADNWFVSLDGPDDVLPEMFIGRIPVETAAQAVLVVNKIISYENLPYNSWNKEILFFNGGINSSEQNIFLSQANTLIGNHIEVPPFNGKAIKLNKTTNEAITLALRNVAAEKINKGVLWVNFLGHAGSSVWDIDIGQPEDWQNTEIFPFITGMSCHSARFANPVISSLSEEFVLNPMGASAYWGSTGFGFITQDFVLLDGLLPAVTKDSVRSVGEATTLAKISLWGRLGDQPRNRNVINQYTIIGDPALNLVLSRKPELAIRSGEITFESDFLLTTDSTTTVSAKIHNYGLTSQDSVEIQFSVFDPAGNRFPVESFKIKPFGILDSLTVYWSIPKVPGLYRFQVHVDPSDLIQEEDNLNNVAEQEIYVFSSELTTIKPLAFDVVTSSTPELVTNNSRIGGSGIIYHFEVDASKQFNSPLLIQSNPIEEGKLVTKWSPQLPVSKVFHWRVRTYNGMNYGPWESSSFAYLPTSSYQWQQSNQAQFENNFLENLVAFRDNEIKLPRNQFIYKAESAGFKDGGRALLLVNNEVAGAFFRGHNVAVFDGTDGSFLFFQVYDTYVDAFNAEAMAELINGLPEGNIVMSAILDEGSEAMTENAFLALESIGSALTRQVGFRESWAIIGRKGVTIGSVPEAMSKAGEGPVAISDTLYRFEKMGKMASPEIGPALEWKTLALAFDDSPPDERIKFQIIGLNTGTKTWESLMTDIADVESVDLSSIDARVYPKIKLEANLSTETGLDTPQLDAWSLDFVPPPDLIVGRGSVTFQEDTVLIGNDAELNLLIANFGLSPSDSFNIRFLHSDAERGDVEFNHMRVSGISIDAYKEYSTNLPTDRLSGKTKITVELDPDQEIPEINETNNTIFTNIWVARDTVVPEIRVTFDGREVVQGDFVSSNPQIVAEIRDNDNNSIQDTAQVTILVDEERIVYGTVEGQARLIPQDGSNDSDLNVLVVFSHQLMDGEHTIEIIVKDNSGNLRYFQNQFYVNSEFLVADVMNHPNPFRTQTDFTYILTQPADEVRIKIYTISGRLIRELDFAPTGAGFNQLRWNGRDHDGNTLGNGVYLYKIIVRKGEEQIEVVEKFVVMR